MRFDSGVRYVHSSGRNQIKHGTVICRRPGPGLLTEKETEWHCIPSVKPVTSLSDPEACPITHSLTEGDGAEEEVGSEGRKIRREEKWPWRRFKSQQAQTDSWSKQSDLNFPPMTTDSL